MSKLAFFLLFLFLITKIQAQLVEVQADYNGVGDCIFSAYNNSETPMFLNLNFADLENTSFPEPLPYVKMLEPGFNSLFTLERDLDADVPRFNYEIAAFKSNPVADVDLRFPYLLPFSPGTKVKVFDVRNIDGFWGNETFKSWAATGFFCRPGEPVFASRRGIVVEIVGDIRKGDPQTWYHTFTNAITVLQPDGTLICYKNVVDKSAKLKVNQIIYPGQQIGEIALGANEMLLLIFHQSLHTKDLRFIIPEFMVDEKKQAIVNSALEYMVVHPVEVRALEMSKKEKRKILGIKK